MEDVLADEVFVPAQDQHQDFGSGSRPAERFQHLL